MSDADTATKTAIHGWTRYDAMTDAEAHAVAVRDPDARPISDEDFARVKQVPRSRTLRRVLRLTPEEFAARFHIPLATLQDWEHGRAEPDEPARAYLAVIAADPSGVRRALEASHHGAA